MICDRSCIELHEDGSPTGLRRFPIEKKCCALAAIRGWDEVGRDRFIEAFRRVLEAQIGPDYAKGVIDAWEREVSLGGGDRVPPINGARHPIGSDPVRTRRTS